MVFLSEFRPIYTSLVTYGKRNFRKFPLFEKRLDWHARNILKRNPDPLFDMAYDRGVRKTEIKNADGVMEEIHEMIPEIIVPNLEGFKLKPYVSYRVPDVVQAEFTAQDLFHAVYSSKMAADFKQNKLDPDGTSLSPSEEELLTAEEAKNKSQKTGADLFSYISPPETF